MTRPRSPAQHRRALSVPLLLPPRAAHDRSRNNSDRAIPQHDEEVPNPTVAQLRPPTACTILLSRRAHPQPDSTPHRPIRRASLAPNRSCLPCSASGRELPRLGATIPSSRTEVGRSVPSVNCTKRRSDKRRSCRSSPLGQHSANGHRLGIERGRCCDAVASVAEQATLLWSLRLPCPLLNAVTSARATRRYRKSTTSQFSRPTAEPNARVEPAEWASR